MHNIPMGRSPAFDAGDASIQLIWLLMFLLQDYVFVNVNLLELLAERTQV
jgi:hypothetical protein